MNRATLLTVLVVLCALGNAACGGSNSTTGLEVNISTAPTSMLVGATANVAATVTDDPKNGGVTWSCTPAPFCGTASFNPDQTPSGSNSVFTAPSVVPPGSGQVTITATSVTDTSISSNSVNITIGVASNNFSFYVTGKEANEVGDTYSIAGIVTIATDGSGNVLGGVEDYNDGDGITSPQPNGDSIAGGSLVMAGDGSGNGILTLMIPGNAKLGVNGVESFAVNFPNTSHALIAQFDGTATSSGSLDLQTSTTIPTAGGFSFVASGAGTDGEPVADGGIFTITGISIAGFVDVNDGGDFLRNTPFSGTLGPADSSGRGTITNNAAFPVSLNYYVVGPEVIRIINVDATDTAVGSAFSQGANPSFSNDSIRQSVFLLENNPAGYAAAGQFSTSPEAAAKHSSVTRQGEPASDEFNGIGDLNELDGAVLAASPISGTFNLGANGYGTFNFDGGFGDVNTLGMYAVDPSLNVLDPNNPSAGGALAVLAEMDGNLVGIGSLLPQTETTAKSFAGFYAFGAQGQTSAGFDEFDFLGGATVSEANAAFAGTGSLSDPFATLTGGVESRTAKFAATAVPDTVPGHAGRYTLNPVAVSSTQSDFTPFDFPTVTAYQANGQQLFWVEVDLHSEFGGSLQQNPASVPPDAKKAKPNTQKH